MLEFFMPILSTLRSNGIFYGHLVQFVVIRYIFPHFGTLYREKSGNPTREEQLGVNVAIKGLFT
jgi:hypothetical protein